MAGSLRRLSAVMVLVAALVGAGSLSVASAVPPVGGSVSPDVVGGSPATTQQYPWVVALTTTSGFQYCGGTLVAPNKVVTAAHCTTGDSPSAVRVVAGRTDLRTSDGVVAGVTNIWIHPRFRQVTRGYDVSVLTLDRNLSLQTMALASSADSALYAAGTQATILGWGNTTEGGSASPVLMQATVPVVSDADCKTAYRKYDPTAMVCAGYPQGGVDTCQGDSGGPMVAGSRLIGITSWGTGCARPALPGVYVRVASYHADLIQQINS